MKNDSETKNRGLLKQWKGPSSVVFPFLAFTVCTGSWLLLPLLGLRTFAAVDILETGAPYRNVLGHRPHVVSVIQTDQVEQLSGPPAFYKSLRAGRWQKWDPHIAAGTPTGTLPLNGILSPFSIGYLFLPGWYAVGLKVALTFIFCQCFTYLLLRRLGAAVVPATLGAIAYTFTGTNLVLVHRVSAQLVLPALLWATHRLVERPSIRRTALLSVFIAWTWFEGFPSAFVYCIYLTGAWAGWLIFRQLTKSSSGLYKWPILFSKKAFAPLGALVWGLGLASINLIPLVMEVTRRGILETRTSHFHLPAIQLFGIFDLAAQGRYPKWWSGANPVESVTHIGMIVALGMFVGLLASSLNRLRLSQAGREAWPFFCGLAIVGVTLNFLGGPLASLAYSLPGVAHNPITRSRFVIGLAATVIATLALDGIWKRSIPSTSRIEAPRAASFITLALLCIVVVAVAPNFIREALRASEGEEILASVAKNLLLTSVAALLVLAAFRSTKQVFLSGLGIAVCLYIQLVYPLRNFTPAAPVADYYSPQRAHTELRRLLAGRYRFAATSLPNFHPNSSQLFGIFDLRGQALHSQEFKALIRAINPVAFDLDPLKIIMTKEQWNLNSPLLDDLSVRFFALGTDENPFGLIQEQDDRWEKWTKTDEINQLPVSLLAPGPIVGIAVPIKGNRACERTSVSLSLSSKGRMLSTATRPGFDLSSNWLPFAIDGQGLKRGDPFHLEVTAGRAECKLEIGIVGEGAALRPARKVLIPDPSLPVRLVSTDQAWVYERPRAWPLISSHGQWRSFPNQAQLLAYAGSRPAPESDIASFVGKGPVMQLETSPAQIQQIVWSDNDVRFAVNGTATTLVVVSQNADQGWSASVDGKPAKIVKVDGILAGVFVPSGQHSVRLAYRPWYFTLGAAISIAALLLIFVLLFTNLYMVSRKPTNQPNL